MSPSLDGTLPEYVISQEDNSPLTLYINSSKTVWKSEFDQELLSYLNNNRRMFGIIRKIVKFSVNDTLLFMIMAYMEVQCFEMWGKVKLEKQQNDPSWVSHSILFLCWWKSFPMSLSLLCIITLTLTWIQTNVCNVSKQTTNKQTNKDVWAFKKRTLNHLISQNVHHINHNKGIKNEVAGAWFA